MANITLTITADSAEELRDTLTALADVPKVRVEWQQVTGPTPGEDVRFAATQIAAATAPATTAAAEPEVKATRSRGRPKKDAETAPTAEPAPTAPVTQLSPAAALAQTATVATIPEHPDADALPTQPLPIPLGTALAHVPPLDTVPGITSVAELTKNIVMPALAAARSKGIAEPPAHVFGLLRQASAEFGLDVSNATEFGNVPDTDVRAYIANRTAELLRAEGLLA